jgi:arsenical pump membrane protein
MNLDWVFTSIQDIFPILVFLGAISIVAELADFAGVFSAASQLAARWDHGSIRRLWLIVVLLSSLTTIFLSLDTTAVLLTPVVLVMASRIGISPWPFALTTVWLANTASLVLPVSNLTNLLLVNRLHWSVFHYATRMWFPALVAILVTLIVLIGLLRTSLRGHYSKVTISVVRDPLLFRLSLVICLLVGPFFLAGIVPWLVAVVSALILLIAFSIWQRDQLTWTLFPLRLLLITLALFLTVGFLQHEGLNHWLSKVAGTGDGFLSLLRLATSGAIGSNMINNLPAYVALEPLAGTSSIRMLALLIGTNLGPLITLWASLATLLWVQRCKSAQVSVSIRKFTLAGLVGVPILLLSTVTALWMTR